MTVQLVSEHEIMQQAYKEANSVVQDAHAEADAIMSKTVSESNALKTATNQYLDDALASIQNILNTSIEGLNVKYDSLLRSLESSLEVTTKNRKTFQQNQAAIDAAVRQEASEADN